MNTKTPQTAWFILLCNSIAFLAIGIGIGFMMGRSTPPPDMISKEAVEAAERARQINERTRREVEAGRRRIEAEFEANRER